MVLRNMASHILKNLDTDFSSFTKINSKWITHLNIKWKPLQLLGENLDDLGSYNEV
jgi:hypothetical protein